MNRAPGIQYAIKDLRSPTICFAKSNSSFDIGSRLRNLLITALALPSSSLIGVGARSATRFTNTEAKAAKTNASTKAGIARLPTKPKFIYSSPLLRCRTIEDSETRPHTVGTLNLGTTCMPHHQSPGAPSTSANRTVRVASQPDLSGGSIGQDTPELVARFDAEFDEDLFQVVLDGACAEE